MAFKMSNKLYDALKYLVLIVIPALTTLYVTLDSIFGWGFGDVVAKVSAAVCVCIGGLIGISTAQYNRMQ
jgi:O-antigen/teichoic acid export membrane protein